MSASEVLDARNPFCSQDIISGCPKCFSVNEIRGTCDYPGCWEPDTMGTPTANGYRRTCWKHRLEASDKIVFTIKKRAAKPAEIGS
jgi:hypothetical protein